MTAPSPDHPFASHLTTLPAPCTYNSLLRAQRAIGERGFGLLKGRWKVLRRVTASPRHIGDIARSALVLTTFLHNQPTQFQ